MARLWTATAARAGPRRRRRHAMVVAVAGGDAQRRQERDQHQAGAVRHGHQERPGAEAGHAGGHAEADPVAVAVERVPGGPADQHEAGRAAHQTRVEHQRRRR